MNRIHCVLALCTCAAALAAQQPVSFGSLVHEARDLQRLSRRAATSYHVVQWSSFDRRSRGPEDPAWFSNADGFGGEPVPNVAAVLDAPGADGVGRYLLGEMSGPGALVRTWTAGMNGTMRVELDGQLLWEGAAQDFLERRATRFLEAAGLPAGTEAPAVTFEQEDADYLPVPFAKSLRVEWTGSLRGLHFYQFQVRRYQASTDVRSFCFADLATSATELAATAQAFREPAASSDGESVRTSSSLTVEAGAEQAVELAAAAGSAGEAIVRLRLRVDAVDRAAALRGVLLRVAFDGAQRPQVEAPLGDFFGSGPGVNPFTSLPFSVGSDGSMECRFVMPYARACRIAFRNLSGATARIECERDVRPYRFDEQAMYFRARWRVDRDLHAEGGASPFDLPFVMLHGAGRFVGCAVQVVNPSGIPTPGGNWWGEGDEKVFVDDDAVPSTFGTGSEDYFNYSWSRPDLFSRPYCGQPLCSGPGTAGFVSNHRFQILDDLPFERFFAFLMEMWTHRPLDGVEYGRIAYLYARPGALDDHVRIQSRDVELPVLPERAPVADGGARGATLFDAWNLDPQVGDAAIAVVDEPLATRRRVVGWNARLGEVLRLSLALPTDGAFDVNLVAVHAPDAARVRVRIAGQPVKADGGDVLDLRTDHLRRVLSVGLAGPPLTAGRTTLELECVEPGFVGLDYAWVKLRAVVVPGCVEGESLQVVDASDGVTWEDQGMSGAAFSGGRQLWVKARKVGDRIVLAGLAPSPGRYRARLRATESWDYAILAIDVGRVRRVARLDTSSEELRVGAPVDLGTLEVGADRRFEVIFEVIGTNPRARAPGTYFGIDGIVLDRLDG